MRAFALAAALLICAAARAQEIDIFDWNDFIDPRERGAEFKNELVGLEKPGSPFYLVRLYGGGVSDYQWRNSRDKANLTFLHGEGSFYRSDKQLNLQVTFFHADNDAKMPTYRAMVQFGKYFSIRGKDGQRVANRILFLYAVEDDPYGSEEKDGIGPVRDNHELGIELDMQLGTVDGAFIWMRRRVDAATFIDRLSYLYRFRERERSNGRLRFSAAIGAGTERRTEGWQCCLARAVLTATFVVPLIDTGVNVAWAPTYSPSSTRREMHHEVAVSLDRTVLARIGSWRRN
jgi:hypothetical protein